MVAGVKEAAPTPFYTVWVGGGKGFDGQEFSGISVKLGRKWYHEFSLDPDTRIRARFADEHGNPVQASIRVGGGSLDQVAAHGHQTRRQRRRIQHQATDCVRRGAYFATSGTQVVHVEAEPGYFPIDTTIALAKGANDLRTFVLTSRRHRVRVVVRRGSPSNGLRVPALPNAPPVVGARVRVGTVDSVAGVTGPDGSVVLEWTAVGTADTSADLYIDGPSNADYLSAGRTCNVPERPTPVECVVRLVPGTRVSGKVYAGASDSTPLAGARVHMDGSDRDTTSGPDGLVRAAFGADRDGGDARRQGGVEAPRRTRSRWR